MRYRTWVRLYLITTLAGILFFALFNYTIDPLWTFCHHNRFNNAQPGFDERQQKTNRAYFCGLKQYDTLLLGSSRTTYINQHDFTPMHVFNYASVAMYPSEYRGWIAQAKKIKGTPFRTIILGVDFFGTNNGSFGKQQMKEAPDPSHYFDITTSFLYRYKMLFTLDTLYRSIASLKHATRPGTTDYTRDNVKQTIHISAARKAQAVQHQQGLYGTLVYGKSYHYNPHLKEIFESLKKENPHTRFILFTTPISKPLFCMLVKQGKLPAYEAWLRMLVNVFGEVYDFMGINTVTQKAENYADLHHFYPEFGTLIAKRITGQRDLSLPDDFGIRVTPQNIEKHLKQVERQAQQCK